MKSKISRSIFVSLVVAIFLLIAMLFIAKVHHYTSDMVLKRQFYEQGIALTRALSFSIWSTLDKGTGDSPEKIFNTYDLDSLDAEIRHLIEGTPILKLKMFNARGRMKYSSNRNDVIYGDGDDLRLKKKTNLVALEVVKNNQPTANYRFRKSFDDGDKKHLDRYIFSAYLPVHVPGTEQVGAVVEIYHDVTNIIDEFNNNRTISNVILALSGIVLFILISYLIMRNEKISQIKEEEREKYLAILKSKNHDLQTKTKELTKIKERAEKIAEQRSTFMARMSHELRTPMSAVIGLTDLMMRTTLSDRQCGYINAIQSSGNMLLDITDEIISIGRLETGYLEINQQPFLLRNVIDNVMEVMGNRACKQGLELICEYTSDIDHTVMGDTVRLRQILINLVGNAIKFTKSGSVTICVRHVKVEFGLHHYLFEVIDTGIGIDAEDQEKVFAAYCYLNNQNTTPASNSGLGLTISQRLVEAMNGIIGVDSSIGEGSRFWVKLPLETIDIAGNSQNEKLKNIASSNVLIIAKCSDTAKALLSTFKQREINATLVHTFHNAEKLMQRSIAKERSYSLFFIDYDLGKPAIAEIVEKIRQYSEFDRSYIVFMTPISEARTINLVHGINKCIYINKPILPGKLSEVFFKISGNELTEASTIPNLAVPEPLQLFSTHNRRKKVLVVEDNPINREVLVEMLVELGFFVNGVESGRAALEFCMDKYFDLILLDYRLPDMEGHEVAAKIRKMNVQHKQPTIIVTSSDKTFKSQQLCRESGVDDFLDKPIIFSTLSKKLLEWMKVVGNSDVYKRKYPENSTLNLFSAPILDKDVIIGFKKHDSDSPGFFNNLIEMFINDGFDRIEKLKEQIEQSNYIAMERTTHSIKSGCIHIGARRMAKYCDVLSNMARNQSSSETRRALQYFTEEFDRLILALDSERNSSLGVLQ